MTTADPTTQTLAAWLTARLDADEGNARRYLDVFPDGDMAPLFRRVLATVAAHRRIVEAVDGMWSNVLGEAPDGPLRADPDSEFNQGLANGLAITLRALASIYAGAEGWQEEWSS